MDSTPISFEFFPPRTDAGKENLQNTWRLLNVADPEFFSVTFGAGGTTQDGTFETVKAITADIGVEAAPHLSCIGSTRENIATLLAQYHEAGVKRIVALRGDLPSGMMSAGEFRYASELVEFIRQEHADHFKIEVAAYPEMHPQAESPDVDLENFVRKVQAGADAAMTQYFYNSDSYFDFCDRVEQLGVNIPVVPGIMPITTYTQLARFSDACGAEIPRWIRQRLKSYEHDPQSLRAFGADVVTELCLDLISGGAPALHFYTLNKAENVLQILNNLEG
ncbi:MAG: methylenetetrahydrofolate reductase (NADPH) [Gammaproteobacteria bacterium]